MAHNLNYNFDRNSYSFFSRKELAWHGLGQVVKEAVTASEALKLANLDYQVDVAPIWANFIPKGCKAVQNIDEGFDCYNKSDNSYVCTIKEKAGLMRNHRATYRTDTQETFGVVGNLYTPVQNSTSLDFIYDILKHNPDIKEKDDIIIETAGALGLGERIFVTAKLPKGFIIGKDDVTDLYVVFTNSHDGTSALTALVTQVRVVCNNTLTAALGNHKAKISFKHTTNIANAMKEGAALMRLSYKNADANRLLYDTMLHKNVSDTEVKNLINQCMLDTNQLDQIAKYGLSNVPTEIISTRIRNTIEDVNRFVDMGVGQENNRGTLYWAYMGMNTYLNNGISYKDPISKFDSIFGGTTAKKDEKMLKAAIQLL